LDGGGDGVVSVGGCGWPSVMVVIVVVEWMDDA